MHAIREIVEIDSDTLNLHLPPGWKGLKRAEVIIWPLEDELEPRSGMAMSDFVATFSGAIQDFPEIEPEGSPEDRLSLDK